MYNRHRIESAEDQYNDLVAYIIDVYAEVFGMEQLNNGGGVYNLVSDLAEAATFKDKFNDRIREDINHSFVMLNEMTKAFIAIGSAAPTSENSDENSVGEDSDE